MSGDTIVESITVRTRSFSPRDWVLALFLITAVGLLTGRSIQLQVVEGSVLHGQAEGNRVLLLPQTAPRGIIYDLFGEQLVDNVASSDVILDPVSLPSEENEGVLIDALPRLLPVTHDDVREALRTVRSEQKITLVLRAISHEEVIALKREQASLPGIQIVSSLVRDYNYAHAMAPVLGYTGTVTAEDVNEDDSLLLTEPVGKSGIEKQYNDRLRGVHGASYVEVDASNRPQKIVSDTDSVPGEDLNLHIDAELQRFIFDVMAEDDRVGAVVALDPRSGAVRALVSYPSYDANSFSQPSRRDEAVNFLQDSRQPLFNRAVAGMYPPGSTIKPFIAAAALHEGIIAPSTTILSTGGISIGPWNFPDWKSGGHGVTDVKKAIAESVNTFFYLVAGGDTTRDGLGVRLIGHWLSEFGWGKQTGIDLPSEASGHLPTPEWKQQVKGEPWYIGDTYHLGIGQGDILATPLQIALATSAIANGGTVYTPVIVQSETQNTSHVTGLSSQELQVVQEGMRETVISGSGRALLSLPVETAGKTGTAQTGDEDTTHAWYTSFGPYSDPELVITVLLEKGGEGDEHAVPVAKEIWQWWAENRH